MNALLRWWMRLVGRGDQATCREALTAVQDYLDHRVDPALAHRIERHLQACRRCGLEARTYTEIKAALARRGGTGPAAVDPAVLARLRTFGAALVGAAAEDPRWG